MKPERGDEVLCDPDFSPEHKAENMKPNCIVPARVIQDHGKCVYVEILDEEKASKRVSYTNTDRFGATCMVLIEAVQKQAI